MMSSKELKEMTKAELQAALEAAEALNAKLNEDNDSLRKNKRPSDALVGSICLTFQKGTHQELVGKRVKFHIPPEAIRSFVVSCEVKRNKNGNAYVFSNIVIDTPKLNIEDKVLDSAKEMADFAESVGLSSTPTKSKSKFTPANTTTKLPAQTPSTPEVK